MKDFNKNINFFYYEFNRTNNLLINLRKLDKNKKIEVNRFYQEILEDKNISETFKKYILKLLN